MTVESHDLPTERECPQCNTPMKPFKVQSRNPGKEIELDRCHKCHGVWFDAGELEIATGRSVIKSKSASDRYCPKCAIPLLNSDLTAGVAVESCRICKGTYLDAKDILTVTKTAPARPPKDVSFECSSCHKQKPFATAHATVHGTECGDCLAGVSSPAEHAQTSVFGSFVGWLRGDR